MTDPVIYHVAERTHWRAALARGEYRRSTREQTLEEVGFIHCSTAEQVRPVLERFYAGVDDLVLLSIETAPFGDDLVFELAEGRDELFPHLYVALPVAAVSAVTDLADIDEVLGPEPSDG
jgi:glutathione S-transferase